MTEAVADKIEQATAALLGGRTDEAARLVREGLALAPASSALWNLQGGVMMASGQLPTAAVALSRAARFAPADPEPLRNLAKVRLALADWAGLSEASEALARLVPGDPDARQLMALGQVNLSLKGFEDGLRLGFGEGGEAHALQQAHDTIVAALNAGIPGSALSWVTPQVLLRLLAHATMERVGSFEADGRRWAQAGEHRVLLMQQARARPTAQDRQELLNQHRQWGLWAESQARRAPSARPEPNPSGRIRLGFLSSDLRNHPVGVFAQPLFDHPDPRFDFYAYSFFPGPADALEEEIAGKVVEYRRLGEMNDFTAAETIALDGLDVLIDLGGPTGWNRPAVLAHKPARLTMSWLGYAHSTGLATIDHILLDPALAPADPALVLEKPLLFPNSWIALSPRHFRDDPAVAPQPPSVRNGYVTFGTANAPHKVSPLTLDLWGRVLAAVPNSRFLVVRPEAEAPTFRENLLKAFAAHGVAADRVRFEAVRGQHLPLYGEMDASLDTAPMTGGTTTCESLWMGCPVVTLVGAGLPERQSAAILKTLALDELVAETQDAYVAAAVAVAGDPARLASLRTGMRDRIRRSVLWDAEGYARDFYDLIAGAIGR